MTKSLFVLILALLFTINLTAQSPAQLQWERSQNGMASMQHAVVKTIQDASGNIYVLSNANGDMVLVKFNNSGGVLYSYVYNDTYNASDFARDFTIDGLGNAYIVGDYFTFNSPQWGPRTILIKVNTTGQKEWEYNYYSYDYQYYEPHTYNAISLDASNNIYVAGTHVDSMAVCKFNNAGQLQLLRHLTVDGHSRGVLNDIAIDGTGNIYVTGFVRTNGDEPDAMVAKISSTGTTTWTKRIAGAAAADDNGYHIGLDQSSNVYVVTSIADTSDTHFSTYLTKYNASGGQQFIKHLYTTGQINSIAADLIVDNLGNSYVAVCAQGTSNSGVSKVYKHNSSGTLNYEMLLDNPTYSNDAINDIFLDVNNNLYATGDINNPLYGNHFYAKIHSTGSLLFNNQLAGSSIDGGRTFISADASGFMNVVGHTGKIYNVRLNVSGTFQFEGTYAGVMNTNDVGVKIIAQGSGSVYALGNMYNELSNTDMVVVKYDAQGNTQWQNIIDDNTGYDYAHDMGRDSIYNIYVLGEKLYGTNLVKIDSIGSILWNQHSDKRYRKSITQPTGVTYLAAEGEAYWNSYKTFQIGKIDANSNVVFETSAVNESDYSLKVGSMGIDANDNIIVAGDRKYKLNQPEARVAIVVEKFNSSGTLTWHREIPIQDSITTECINGSYVSKVLINDNNDIFVFGTQDTVFPGHSKVFLTKINAAGTIQWTQYYYNTYGSHAVSTDARMLSTGQIVLYSGSHDGPDVKKINPNTGLVLWELIVPGIQQAFGGSLRLDNNDDIFIGGRDEGDVFLAKIGTAGNIKWVQYHQGQFVANDYINHIDVTNSGRIYVVGSFVNSNGENTDFTVLKFCDIAKPVITTTGATQNICSGSTAILSADGGVSYLWSNSSVNDSIIVGTNGDYYCSVYKSDGCYKNTDTVNVMLKTPPSIPQICLVTVDSLSTHNVIVWDKTATTGTSAFNIFREDVTNVYSYIATVPYDSLSEYHDFNANPNITTKRYKMSAIDSCGQESAQGNYHNTLYIVSNGSGQFSWNPLYTIENTANPVNNYILMRDDNSTGAWAQVAITAGTQNTIVDPAFASFPNASYRVETIWNITCDPTRGAINTTRSNIKTPTSIGIDELNAINTFGFAPNPANENITISTSVREENLKLEIYNTLGQKVIEQKIESAETKISIQELQAGTYFVKLIGSQNKSTKKLIKY